MTTWADIRSYITSTDMDITDAAGTIWRRTDGNGRDWLYRRDDKCELVQWHPLDDDLAFLPPAGIPEPPDGSRIEFEHYTDVYAAWRDDASSVRVGWVNGEVWCLYGESVPKTWDQMWALFGNSLVGATRLVPASA